MRNTASKQLNILAISHLFPNVEEKRYGIFSARQLQAMHKLGAEITVFVPAVWCPSFLRRFKRWKKYNHERPLCRFEGLKTIAIPYPRPPGNWYNRWAGLAVFEVMKKKARQLHEQKSFDVIYAIDLFPDGDAAARLGKYIHVPATCLCIGVDANVTANSSKIIYKHYLRVVEALNGAAACGKSVKDRIDSVKDMHSLCVYGTLDLKEFTPVTMKSSLRRDLELPPDKLIVLFAGYIERRKGIYELIEAVSEVRKSDNSIILVMCGSGDDETELMQLIREKKLSDVIQLAGTVDPDQMHKWMQASDLFVLPSYTEGVPNVVMEAMACGLPVIATSVGGLPDAFGDCEGVILIPPRDIDALTQAILKVAGSIELRSRMGIASRNKAEQNYGVDRNAMLVLDYLADVIDEKPMKPQGN